MHLKNLLLALSLAVSGTALASTEVFDQIDNSTSLYIGAGVNTFKLEENVTFVRRLDDTVLGSDIYKNKIFGVTFVLDSSRYWTLADKFILGMGVACNIGRLTVTYLDEDDDLRSYRDINANISFGFKAFDSIKWRVIPYVKFGTCFMHLEKTFYSRNGNHFGYVALLGGVCNHIAINDNVVISPFAEIGATLDGQTIDHERAKNGPIFGGGIAVDYRMSPACLLSAKLQYTGVPLKDKNSSNITGNGRIGGTIRTEMPTHALKLVLGFRYKF